MSEQLNGFTVDIIADRVRPIFKNKMKFYAIPHWTNYKLVIGNQNNMACDVKIFIDGERVGAWRNIKPNSTLTVERPVNVNRKFTFVKELSSPLFHNNKYPDSAKERGLIKVVFYPERYTVTNWQSPKKCTSYQQSSDFNSYPHNFRCSNKITPNAPSQQGYDRVFADPDLSLENITTITLKLVTDDAFYKPFISTTEMKKNADRDVPNLKNIPLKDRQYDDFFLLNHY